MLQYPCELFLIHESIKICIYLITHRLLQHLEDCWSNLLGHMDRSEKLTLDDVPEYLDYVSNNL